MDLNTNSTNEKVNDHDLLIAITQDMCWLKKMFSNHLAHHWAITLAVAVSALGAITSLVLYILKA
jgi:hypothetical protein